MLSFKNRYKTMVVLAQLLCYSVLMPVQSVQSNNRCVLLPSSNLLCRAGAAEISQRWRERAERGGQVDTVSHSPYHCIFSLIQFWHCVSVWQACRARTQDTGKYCNKDLLILVILSITDYTPHQAFLSLLGLSIVKLNVLAFQNIETYQHNTATNAYHPCQQFK